MRRLICYNQRKKYKHLLSEVEASDVSRAYCFPVARNYSDIGKRIKDCWKPWFGKQALAHGETCVFFFVAPSFNPSLGMCNHQSASKLFAARWMSFISISDKLVSWRNSLWWLGHIHTQITCNMFLLLHQWLQILFGDMTCILSQ